RQARALWKADGAERGRAPEDDCCRQTESPPAGGNLHVPFASAGLKLQELIRKGVIAEVRVIRAGFGSRLNESARNVRLDGCRLLLRERDAHFFPRGARAGRGTR